MTSRNPGEGRYAQLEREQRWRLKELPTGVANERVIVDHYWTGTSLRLRMIDDGTHVAYKLCQKIRRDAADPEFVRITNMYLSEDDFHALSVTPASIVAKSRWTLSTEGVEYAVDEFKGRHDGLVLAEIELPGEADRISGPIGAVADVTNVNEYSGGWLAAAPTADLLRLLRD